MMTSSTALHFIVSVEDAPNNYCYVKVTKEEMENTINGLLSPDAWQDLDVSLSHIFGRYADFIDISEAMLIQDEDIRNDGLVKSETLKFLKSVYGEINCFSSSMALAAGV